MRYKKAGVGAGSAHVDNWIQNIFPCQTCYYFQNVRVQATVGIASPSIGAGRVVATRPFKHLVSIALLHNQTPERRGNFKGNFERSWLSKLRLRRLTPPSTPMLA